MLMSKVHLRSLGPVCFATIALAIGTASAVAQAAAVDEAATAAQQRKMAACKSEMSSLRDMCASEAGWGSPVRRENLSPQERQAITNEVSRYKMAVASCDKLLGNNRPICVSRAGTPSSLIAM